MPDNQVTLVHSTASMVASTGAVIVANVKRKYLRIQNDDAALIVWLRIGEAAVANTGIRLGPADFFEMRRDKNNVDPRVVNGIASAAGPAVVIVTEA